MARIKKWISGVFRSHNSSSTDKDHKGHESTSQQPPMPALPSPRKHVLTQNSSYATNPTPENGFFSRFPREIRDQIYIYAVGNRTLHMDLQWKQPNLSDASSHRAHAHTTEHMGRDGNARQEWAWWSSVCHRHPLAEPWDDKCQSGSPRELCEHFYPGDSCFLGVMGWLLSCRQAYIETIDLIYRTNTIHIHSIVLSQRIRSLLLPQRLAAITSLELVWDLLSQLNATEHHHPERQPWINYSYLMEKLPRDFPSLTSLYVSVQTTKYCADPTPAELRSDEGQLFGPADDLVRCYGSKLSVCQIAPTRNLFSGLLERAEIAGARVEQGGQGAGFWKRFWRPVLVDGDGLKTTDLGYWVRQGKDDTPFWQVLRHIRYVEC